MNKKAAFRQLFYEHVLLLLWQRRRHHGFDPVGQLGDSQRGGAAGRCLDE